ncbi:hypothetical protein F5J12DRAFT_217562 [Pisolithus orientalis]|uniref:uncharacterized protein n=1 Tax=Pisolithus orientalis TaxID=936130 RepID=UPI00222505FA|nr:uncharacterized protein F5J12DRAFT_217562 [Pisolithus orientalis]KAI6002486.1 hypothetical protein F5J12DRAFT_217562 [Pisolithus orientalis]
MPMNPGKFGAKVAHPPPSVPCHSLPEGGISVKHPRLRCMPPGEQLTILPYDPQRGQGILGHSPHLHPPSTQKSSLSGRFNSPSLMSQNAACDQSDNHGGRGQCKFMDNTDDALACQSFRRMIIDKYEDICSSRIANSPLADLCIFTVALLWKEPAASS